jgi:hypothetical protein
VECVVRISHLTAHLFGELSINSSA